MMLWCRHIVGVAIVKLFCKLNHIHIRLNTKAMNSTFGFFLIDLPSRYNLKTFMFLQIINNRNYPKFWVHTDTSTATSNLFWVYIIYPQIIFVYSFIFSFFCCFCCWLLTAQKTGHDFFFLFRLKKKLDSFVQASLFDQIFCTRTHNYVLWEQITNPSWKGEIQHYFILLCEIITHKWHASNDHEILQKNFIIVSFFFVTFCECVKIFKAEPIQFYTRISLKSWNENYLVNFTK